MKFPPTQFPIPAARIFPIPLISNFLWNAITRIPRLCSRTVHDISDVRPIPFRMGFIRVVYKCRHTILNFFWPSPLMSLFLVLILYYYLHETKSQYYLPKSLHVHLQNVLSNNDENVNFYPNWIWTDFNNNNNYNNKNNKIGKKASEPRKLFLFSTFFANIQHPSNKKKPKLHFRVTE